MTGPSIPPATSTPQVTAPNAPVLDTSPDAFPSAGSLPSTRAPLVPGPLGRMSIGRMGLYAMGAIGLLFVAKAVLHTDPVAAMTTELQAVGAAETVYHGTHGEFTASLPALQAVSKVKLTAQLVQFTAGKSGYQMTLRHNDTEKQCSLIAGSFKTLGGPPEVSCETVPTPK